MAGDLVGVGRIGRPRGVRGEVFVAPWTDAPEQRFAAGAVLRTDREAVPTLTVETASLVGARLVVRFAGIGDRTAAETLRGLSLSVPASERPALDDPEEFYDSDLVGLSAQLADGSPVGPVTDVVHTAGGSYLTLEIAGRERLVPFVTAIVPTVDLAAGRVVIEPPEGLLEL